MRFFGYETGNHSGTVTFEGQAPTANQLASPTGPQNVSFTSNSNNGDTLNHTETYTLSFTGQPQSQQGYHVKVTVDVNGTQGDKKSKVFWVDGCTPTPTKPTVVVTPLTCSTRNGSTGTATASITNPADNTQAAVSYTWAVTKNGATVKNGATASVADGASTTVNLTGLAPGVYTMTITGSDGTTGTTSFTIAQCDEPVTPAAPIQKDECGTNNDGYTIVATTGVVYKVGNTVVGTGFHPATGTVVITATAEAGYVLQGTNSWTFAFKDVPCDTPVATVAPTKANDECGTANDKYTIPSVEGVDYYVNGSLVPIPSGTYPINGNASIVITAKAQTGYVLTNNSATTWTLTFNTKPCSTTVTPATPGKNDSCGTKDDTYTIPSTTGVIYQVKNVFGVYQTKAAGTYDVTLAQYVNGVEIRALPVDSSYVLSGTTYWKFSFTAQHCDVPATAPSKNDACGTNSDTYTIPESEHVKYYVNFSPIAKPAGTYQATGDVIIVAIADPGYTVSGQSLWFFHFDKTPCDTPVTPEAPVVETDSCGTKNDTYTIPETTGVDYYIDGVVVPAGEHSTNDATSVTVTAKAQKGYTLGDSTNSWTLKFTNTECPPEPCAPSVVSAALVLTRVAETDDDCTPGMGGGGTPSTPATPTSVVTELPQTGPADSNAFVKIATIVVAGIITYGAMFYLVNRRELLRK